MDFLEIFLIGCALSMDAFAVSAAYGISPKKISARDSIPIAASFGFFQMLMPIIGWGMGNAVYELVSSFSKYAAFAILAVVGGKMIFDSLRESESGMSLPLPLKTLMLLSVATSLDALAVGVSFSLVDSPIILPSVVIGLTTFTISLVGVYMGKLLGESVGGKFGVLGGIVLICIGIKILLF